MRRRRAEDLFDRRALDETDRLIGGWRKAMRRRRAEDLFDRIATFDALCAAALRAAAGKRRVAGPAAFLAGLETEVLGLERELRAGTWRPGGYVAFEVTDPKQRLVSAAPFRDRVVHHAVHAVIAPLFERGFIHHSYANRVDRGTHRAVARYERLAGRHRYVLRGDVFRYFPAIDHEVLKADLRRRIGCGRTLAVLDRIIDGSNPQEPVYLYYPGDDLFTPYERRRGLPIGNLTSQLFANVYLDRFDHFVAGALRAPYLRYVDDFAAFADDPARLAEWRSRAEAFLARRRLSLHPLKTFVAATAAPATFLGFELRPGGRRRLPEENVRRFRNRLRGLRDRWRAGTVTRAEVEQRVGAWVAHAAHADTWRLRRAIFRDGWFAPARPPVPGAWPAPGRRVVRGGSWNNNSAEYLGPGARNRNRAGDRNTNSGFRVASTPRSRSRRGHGRAGRARGRPGPVMMSRRRRMSAAASRPAPVLVREGDGRRPAVLRVHDGVVSPGVGPNDWRCNRASRPF